MSIELTIEQRRLLEAAVASGPFSTLEQALEAALVGLATFDERDDEWVKPLLDLAQRDVAAGDTISLDEFKHHVAERWGRSG